MWDYYSYTIHFFNIMRFRSHQFPLSSPAPEPSYQEPEDAYGPPDDGYGAPVQAYGAPSYAAETGLDLTTLLIPLLALVGLFLLFPTYVTLTSVR